MVMNKIERIEKYKKLLQEFEDFKKDFDLNPIVDYFKIGLEVKIFKNPLNGKPLTEKDNLFFGFNHDGYQYTLRRQPIHKNNDNDFDFLRSMLKSRNIGRGVKK